MLAFATGHDAMLTGTPISLLISQADLAFAPTEIIFTSADGMRQVEADLLRLLQSSEDTALRNRADSLLHNVLQEADMYEAALKVQGTRGVWRGRASVPNEKSNTKHLT